MRSISISETTNCDSKPNLWLSAMISPPSATIADDAKSISVELSPNPDETNT